MAESVCMKENLATRRYRSSLRRVGAAAAAATTTTTIVEMSGFLVRGKGALHGAQASSRDHGEMSPAVKEENEERKTPGG